MRYDFALIHAPSVYDFRERDDVLFAYLSNSDSVHVSPIFEMPPVGIFALEQHAKKLGHRARFFNVASRMLRDAEFDVERFFRSLDAAVIGFDLHWLVHAHGSLALAELCKLLRPDVKTVFGGISSTYFHEELIRYDAVDYVIRGYDTLLPVERLLASRGDPEELARVPNLTFKRDGAPVVNPLSHVPRVYSAAVDWSEIFSDRRSTMTPYNLVIPQAGCEYNCRWCGGSRHFFARYMGLEGGVARVHKSPEALATELASVARSAKGRHTLTMIDFWHEYPELFRAAEDVFVDSNVACVHFSLHRLPKVEHAARMGAHVQAVLELSPDSHDMEVARASGRGHYSMEQMEAFIDALIGRVHSFEIYFMIGLPKQTAENVLETVEYCEHLLEKYRGKAVTPYVCPMLPFLDPGSEIADEPDKHGYRRIHRTLEEHRRALTSLNWRDRLNYETRWMSRQELVDVSYEAVRRLTLAKEKHGLLPSAFAVAIRDLIDETRGLLAEIDAFQALPDGPAKDAAAPSIRVKIRDYNRRQLASVRSQQRPIDLGFARRQWFDTDEAIDEVLGGT
ncbi:MAG TPA: cobalamin-dependent protein [Polyangiaceae bacterium]|nr:cobalamin-dependent protein [Polyangiaceae bacterium]